MALSERSPGPRSCGKWRETSTRERYLRNIGPRRGGSKMCEKLDDLIWLRSIWFAAGSRAKTYRTPGQEPGSTASDRDYGKNSPVYLAKWCPGSSSWRTSVQLLIPAGVLAEFSGSWPRSATMVGGTVYRQAPSAPLTSAIDGSLSGGTGPHRAQYPTPTVTNYGTGGNGTGNNTKSRGRPSLPTMAYRNRWPTPTVKGNYNRAGLSAKSGDGLQTAIGGRLSPRWVEVLMGFPPGFTEL